MWLVAVLAAILLAAVLAGMLYFSRTLALDRLLGKSIELDVRFQAMPTVLKLASEQFLAGSGFGSFDLLYRQAEPFELLMPAYLNHAHNDWLQIVIEGGVPAIVLLVTLLAWLAHTAFILLVTTKRRRAPEDVVAISILVAIALASVVDYPLRTPAMMAFREEFAGPEFRGKVVIHHDNGDPEQAYDLWPVLEEPKGAHLYCCGPRGLMEAVRDMTGHWSSAAVHFEDFGAARARPEDNTPFTVVLAKSGHSESV